MTWIQNGTIMVSKGIHEAEEMRTITLKNIPDDLYERIKETASLNRRSMNSEVLVRLEREFPYRERDPEKIIEQVRKTRESIKSRITDEEINEGKRWGRP